MTGQAIERLLRDLGPRAVAAVARRYGDFVDAEDAVQEALLAAVSAWPAEGQPDNPLGWLVRVASRRVVEQYRRDDARRRREQIVASWSLARPDSPSGGDDTLILMFMCCHPALSPAAAIPLALRAVAGLTTREIATAFLVPEPTMAQRITRAKATLKAAHAPMTMPSPTAFEERLGPVLHVLYLLFNEGHATSGGSELTRADLSGEAIRLCRGIHNELPEDPEVTGLLALMLLTDARRHARTTASGDVIPLADQDRTRWDRTLITEGVALITSALRQGRIGQYQAQAAIAAVHDQAPRYEDTNWVELLALYTLLDKMTNNPMVTLNRAIATGMTHGPEAGLAILDQLGEQLGDHHRFHSTRGYLLELSGDETAAADEFRAAAAGTMNLRERHYLTTKAACLTRSEEQRRPGDTQDDR